MKISEAFGDGSRERESAKDDGAEIFHRRLSLSVSRQMPVSFERSCCVPPSSFCLRSVCLLARTCSLLEGHERGSGGWKKMKKGKREVSFLISKGASVEGRSGRKKNRPSSPSNSKIKKMFFLRLLFLFAALAAAASAQQVPALSLSLSLSLSHSRRFHLRVGLAPLRAVYRAFPRAELSNGCEEEGFIQCSNESFSLPFLFENPPIKQADPGRQQQQLLLPGAVLAPELALEEEGPATHAQAW